MRDTPPTQPLFVTPTGAEVIGFQAEGDEALRWWEQLRLAHPESGLWPLLMDADAPEQLTESYPSNGQVWSAADAQALNGAALLAERGERYLSTSSPSYAAELRAELAGEGVWPEKPERPGFGLPYGWDGEPTEVTVALVPATAPWLVPVTLQHSVFWEPDPAEHSAIMRYWHGRYGAEPVVWTDTTLEYAVARPPTTPPHALALAWEYRQYNDGEFDYYRAATLTELAAGLMNAPVWRVWWD
ncbi:DUF4253 domain-containing protein [Actinoplanes sp. NEAU-A12]|uniref:DUF4253 domain-containing protein n=1 Tax=Actinoplanes sandaracinus TaxID=3045177 RepID=A0ABT6WVC7_9ACTN|nr:DUF4253 domain-containing protein [Actinoplanes sandaracinus]MDI6103639.1 DUF4253 domain-containing protein [Actinoplanes sandaracinus]